MGPGDVSRSAASMDAALLADDGSLEAARNEFTGWDIIEVFGGYLAVPAGTPVVRSTTAGGLAGKLRRLPGSEGDQ